MEGELQLTGWHRSRHVVVLRRRIKGNVAAEISHEEVQPFLLFVERPEKLKLWEYAVLMTNTDYPLETMIATIRTGLDHVLANAPQLPKADR